MTDPDTLLALACLFDEEEELVPVVIRRLQAFHLEDHPESTVLPPPEVFEEQARAIVGAVKAYLLRDPE